MGEKVEEEDVGGGGSILDDHGLGPSVVVRRNESGSTLPWRTGGRQPTSPFQERLLRLYRTQQLVMMMTTRMRTRMSMIRMRML